MKTLNIEQVEMVAGGFVKELLEPSPIVIEPMPPVFVGHKHERNTPPHSHITPIIVEPVFS